MSGLKTAYKKQIVYQLFFIVLLAFSLYGDAPSTSLHPLILQVKNREIVVHGKKAQTYQIVQPNGKQGLSLKKGDRFFVVLENQIDHPTGVHWHGLILPNDQDGVPFVTQKPILPGEKYLYNFPIIQSGTYWMHAHYGLQEQQLLAAPLILLDPQNHELDQQEIVLFLSDFTFRDPLTIFKELRNAPHHRMQMKNSDTMPHKMTKDLNDVKYDAFLANWRTLTDPEIIEVDPKKQIRLRIINGSSTTNFFIHLGNLQGEAIAVDGSEIEPLPGSQFQLAVAQRIDIKIKLPQKSGVFPIIAQGEGLDMQTGLILATPGAKMVGFSEKAQNVIGALSYHQELKLKTRFPLASKKIDRRVTLNLDGDMANYVWMLNGKAWPDNEPLFVKEGERVELIFINRTEMSHPMHLHGHFFQITEIDGQPLQGALRDTILVLPHSTVKVQFDANNPGIWPLHCHNLYHQYAGMMTTLNYLGFTGIEFSREERAHQ